MQASHDDHRAARRRTRRARRPTGRGRRGPRPAGRARDQVPGGDHDRHVRGDGGVRRRPSSRSPAVCTVQGTAERRGACAVGIGGSRRVGRQVEAARVLDGVTERLGRALSPLSAQCDATSASASPMCRPGTSASRSSRRKASAHAGSTPGATPAGTAARVARRRLRTRQDGCGPLRSWSCSVPDRLRSWGAVEGLGGCGGSGRRIRGDGPGWSGRWWSGGWRRRW